jgi:hypothetical protein
MTHITKKRLQTLGMDRTQRPTAAEAAHLRQCTACREVLSQERRLTTLLSAMAKQPAAPHAAHTASVGGPHFVAATCRRFAQALAARRKAQQKRRASIQVALSIGLGLGLSLSLALLIALFFSAPGFFVSLVVTAARLLSLVALGLGMLLEIPFFAFVVLAHMLISLLVSIGLWGGAAKAAAAPRALHAKG